MEGYVLSALPVPTRIAAASMTTADEPKELAGLSFERSGQGGTPGRIRTYDTRIKSPLFYLAELRALALG